MQTPASRGRRPARRVARSSPWGPLGSPSIDLSRPPRRTAGSGYAAGCRRGSLAAPLRLNIQADQPGPEGSRAGRRPNTVEEVERDGWAPPAPSNSKSAARLTKVVMPACCRSAAARRAILQVASYPDPRHRAFPSFPAGRAHRPPSRPPWSGFSLPVEAFLEVEAESSLFGAYQARRAGPDRGPLGVGRRFCLRSAGCAGQYGNRCRPERDWQDEGKPALRQESRQVNRLVKPRSIEGATWPP